MPGTQFSIEIRPILPERLSRLEELANDLYFSWSGGVRRLFRLLDEESWDACNHSPKLMLRRVPQRKLDAAAQDPLLQAEYHSVLSVYDTYLEERAYTDTSEFLDPEQDRVAYFSAEYGFHQSVPIYAGGLGILTADYCKTMSNLSVPFVGVGLLYRQGYYTQRILCGGESAAEYPQTDPASLPVAAAVDQDGNELRVAVDLPGRTVQLRVWEAKVGRIRLYLLDSDVSENRPQDRSITHQLYGGDNETRMQQEIVLGLGGTRALRALGLKPNVWHINEGHAAFLVLERCREYVTQGMAFDEALERVAANTVFTTHTPVAAGHDHFDPEAMRRYFAGLIAELGLDDYRFLALGETPTNPNVFSMTTLALHGSRYANGVSRIHGEVASEIESYAWPQVPPEENPMGYVTNGVDVNTFLGPAWVALLNMLTGGGWRAKLLDGAFWEQLIDDIPTHVYLGVRQVLKGEMLERMRHRANIQYRRGNCTASIAERLTRYLTPKNLDTLIIGFARRFATYKRATLLFRDLDRLARLVNDRERPVVFVFAGKAHPNDLPGQQLIRDIFEISLRPEFQGKIILLEDYNLSLARDLVSGVDVWLNNPEYPLEACGTSGMKAAINGAINLSVLDGWWGEAYDGTNGWAIRPHPELDPESRDNQEASELLNLLENQVIPLYYARNADGEPEAWIERSKASMKSILPQFNSIRMTMDYLRDYYAPAKNHGRRLSVDDAAGARELAAWKRKIAAAWPNVRIRLLHTPPKAVVAGKPLDIEVAVYLKGLAPEDVVVECVRGKRTELEAFVPTGSTPFEPVGGNAQGETTYRMDFCLANPGAQIEGLQHYKIRVYPYHPLLAHRFECGCMLWV